MNTYRFDCGRMGGFGNGGIAMDGSFFFNGTARAKLMLANFVDDNISFTTHTQHRDTINGSTHNRSLFAGR